VSTETHAANWSGDDRTLCGVGDEGTDDNNFTDAPVYARHGEVVTCPDCRAVITHCATFKRFKVA
jgi:hypothetical protein